MEREKILEELKQIQVRIAELKEILASEKKLKAVIVAELREVQKDYSDDRRTQIVDKVDEIKLEDLIADTDMAITVSHAGYVNRTSGDVYRPHPLAHQRHIPPPPPQQHIFHHLFLTPAH